MRKYLASMIIIFLGMPPGYPKGSQTARLHGQISFSEFPQPSVDQVTDVADPPEMRDAWDAWHKRVYQAMGRKFEFARARLNTERPFRAVIRYEVTCDRRIVNARFRTVPQQCFNEQFDSLVLGVVESLNGDPVLEFPAGSRRTVVERSGDFAMNIPELACRWR